jgi:hypothetical protein
MSKHITQGSVQQGKIYLCEWRVQTLANEYAEGRSGDSSRGNQTEQTGSQSISRTDKSH